MALKQELMTIVSQKNIAPSIYELVLTGELVNEMHTPGQFLHIRVPREDLLLRRPISLAEINHDAGTCTIIYRVEGDGTACFSQMASGEQLDVMGPLGNGFDLDAVSAGDTVFIIGGGIGVPPLYELGRQLKEKQAQLVFMLGFASKEVSFYEDKFKELGNVFISTDDGSYGTHGHVGVLMAQAAVDYQEPTAVYACGATGLLRAVEARFLDHPHAYLSLEARMACGMGACYACICQSATDETKNKKVCDEGPVFKTGEVII